MNKNLILIGVAAFAGALLIFRSGTRNPEVKPSGASSYIGTPRINYASSSPVSIGTLPTIKDRTDSVTDALFGRTINLANSGTSIG